MNLAEKLDIILSTKLKIKQAIIKKGGTIEATTPFADYPEQIMAIQSGSGNLNRKELMRRVFILSK